MQLSSSSSSLSSRPPAAAGPRQHSTRACRAVNTVAAATAATSEDADTAPHQQQQQQQPRIVLSPLPAPPGLLSGTASVGSWSTGGYQHQQQPRPQHQHQQRNPKQQQQQRRHQHQQHRPGGSAQGAEMAHLTRTISGATSIQQLIDIFHTRRHTESYNLIHTSTAYRVLVSLLKQQHQQQVAAASTDHVAQLLQLLEQRTVDKLAGAVAATTQRTADAAAGNGSSSSQWQQAPAAVPGWDERAISTIVHSCAHLQHRPEWEYLELLLEAFLLLQAPALQQQRQQQQDQQQQQQHHKQQRKSSPAQDSCHALSLLCWGLAKLGFASESAYQPSSYSSEQQQQQLDEEEWSEQQEQQQQQQQVVQQHERLVLQQHYWARLAAAALQVVPGVASARDLSTLAYGFAAAGSKDVVLWSRLGPHSVAVLESCTPYDMSQLLWAYGTAGVPYQPLIQGAVKAAAQLLPYFAPQGLANVLWAVTSLNGHVPTELMAAASRECLTRDLASFGSVNLNMLVWACARCRHMSPELAVAVNRAVLQLLPTFSVHNLSRVLGALAGLQCLQPAVLEAAEPGLMQRLEAGRIHVQVGCQVVWAYATVDAEAALRLLPPLLALATQHVQQLARSSDATGKLCSTLVMLRYRADEFADALAACLLGETRSAGARQRGHSGAHATQQQDGPMHHWHQQLSIRHILAIAVALARLGYTQHKPLLQALTEQYLVRLPSSITSASARDSHNSRGRSSSGGDAGTAAPAVAASYDEQRMLQHALVLLWCAAVLDMQQPTQLLSRLVKVLHHLQLEQLTTVSLAQAAQVYMWCQTLGPAGAPLVAKLPQPLVTSALQVWQQQLVPAVTRSDMQAAVLSHLRGMQLQPVLEGVTPDGMFSVDVMLRYGGVDVALEVMGPEHYSVNEVLLRPAAAAAAGADHNQQQQASNVRTAPSGRSSRSRAQRGGNATGAAAADEAGQQQQQPPRPQHVLSGPDLLRLRLLAARGFALAAVSSYELGALLSRRPAAVRQLLRGKLDEAVAHHLALPGSLQQPSASAGKAGGKQEQLMSRFALQADMRPVQERKWHRQDRRRQRGSGGDMQQAALQAVLSAALPGASSSVVQQASAVDSAPAAARAAPRLVIEREFDLSLDLDELLPSEDGEEDGLAAGSSGFRAPVEQPEAAL